MMAIGAWNALARHVGRDIGLQLASNALLETQWYLFSACFLLAAAWTLQRDRHVRVDVLHARLSPRARAWIDLLGSLAFLVPTCVAAIVLSLPAVASSIAVLEVSPDPGGLPRWPLKALLPASFLLLALQGCAIAIDRAAFLRGLTTAPSQREAEGP